MGDLRFELRSPTVLPAHFLLMRLTFLFLKEKSGPKAGRIPGYPNPPNLFVATKSFTKNFGQRNF